MTESPFATFIRSLFNSFARWREDVGYGVVIIWATFIFFPGFTPLKLSAQNTLYKQWQVEDGLPQNSVNQIIQTRDGYIWLATHGGLVRFDGVKFTVFNIENTPAFKTNRIVRLLEIDHGQLAIATSISHVAKYKDGAFSVLYEHNTLNQLLPILIDRENHLWILEEYTGRIVVVDRETGTIIRHGYEPLEKIIGAVVIYKMSEEEMIIISPDSIHFWTMATATSPPKLTSTYFPHIEKSLSLPKDASAWIFTGNSLFQFKGGKNIYSIAIPSPLRNSTVYEMYLWNEDEIFFNCVNPEESFSYIISKKQFQPSTFNLGCGGANIESPLKDLEGNNWYATSTCGIFKERRFAFEYIDPDPDHTDQNSYALAVDSQGKILVGTKSGMVVFENGKRVIPPGFMNLPNELVTSFVEAAKNEYYITYNGYETIYHIKDGHYTRISLPISGAAAHTMFKLRSGEIWVSIGPKIFILEDETLTPHPFIDQPVLRVYEYFEDSKNNVWLLTPTDLTKYVHAEKRVIQYDSTTGLKAKFFRGAYEDNEGRLYFGSYGLGLTVYENEKFYNLTTKNGLIENVVSTISADNKGNLWITGNNGLSKFKKEQLLNCLNDPTQKITPVLFDKSDGFRNAEFNGGFPNCKWPMQDGSYLFAMLDGVVKIDLDAIPENTMVPPVIIESITTDDSTYIPKETIAIDYNKGRIEFNYTALSFVSPKNVRFKYKLDGHDADWIEAGTERKTSYTKLAPGSYRFHVIACNNDGLWNETGASINLQIIPPFHMTWWFWTIIGLVLITAFSFLTISIYNWTKKKEHEKAVLMDVLPDLILKVNHQGKYMDIYGNPAALMVPFSEIKGKTIWDILPKDFARQVMEKIKTTIQTKQMQLLEFQMKRQDGQDRDYEGRFISIDKNEVLYIIRDITDTKNIENTIRESEQRLRAALGEEQRLKIILEQQRKQELKSIVNTEERERKRISTDLHDSVGQLLSSIRFNLGMLDSNGNEFSEKDKMLIENSKKYLHEITGEIRNISYNLVPSSLQQFGLISAIQEEIKNQKVNEGLDIQFIKSVQQERFEPEIELVIYRVFQEILNNTLKHAHATELVIQLIQHENIIQLITEDDGKGFEVEDGLQKKNSSGLKNLKSRVTLLNGTISIDSTPNKGTTIIIEIPIHERVETIH